MLSNKKICFISCVNNEKMYDKALFYIKNLNIPVGYKVEILCMKNAKNITGAYNKAMKNSDAQYKVYIHQDVFIINKDFIRDFISIFEENKNIGMLGVVGSKTIPPNGVWWESQHIYGKISDSHTGKLEFLQFNTIENTYEIVKAIDGLIMITQYDIFWREDIFDGWHFYDTSQCMEFQKAGYKIAIPRQTKPWCIHDCGIINFKNGYEEYRKQFLNKYTKVICFSCLTPYHVFVSYILSKTVYKDNYKIIIFSDYHLKKISENSSKLALWDEIILIEEKNRTINSIKQQLNTIDFKNIDTLHYFSYGSTFNRILIDSLFKKTKIILTDEGLSTYFIKEVCGFFRYNYKPQKTPIDLNKISEIWLFDKRLYVSNLHKPIKDIEFKKYLDTNLKFELCNELNIIFDYEYKKKDYDILLFDQCLTLSNITSFTDEKILLTNIIKATKDFNLLVKKHPSDLKDKYLGLDINILEDNGIPWEVIYLNEYVKNNSKIQNKVYISYYSSSLLNTCIIFKNFNSNNYYISLNKLLTHFINDSSNTILLETYYRNSKKFYKENLYEVESFEILNNILSNIIS